MADLPLIVLMVILAVILFASAFVIIGMLFEDADVRPMTEDEFRDLFARPPERR